MVSMWNFKISLIVLRSRGAIYYLATYVDFAKKYHHVVRFIIERVKVIALYIRYVNVRYITVDVDIDNGSNNIVEIYKNAGFKKLNTNTLPEAVLHYCIIMAITFSTHTSNKIIFNYKLMKLLTCISTSLI